MPKGSASPEQLESLGREPPPAPAMGEHTQALRQQTKERRIGCLGSRKRHGKGPSGLVGYEERINHLGIQKMGRQVRV